MLSIVEQDKDRLILGPQRSNELVGLFLLVTGLVAAGVGLLGLIEPHRFSDYSADQLLSAGAYSITALVIGFRTLFTQTKYIFDRQQNAFCQVRWMREPQTWKLDTIRSISIVEKTIYAGEMILILEHGKVVMDSGNLLQINRNSSTLQHFLDIPIDRHRRHRGE